MTGTPPPGPGAPEQDGHVDPGRPPVDDVGRVLASIWRDVLNRPPGSGGVDAGENFFAAGGDSVAAVALLTAIPQRLGVDVEPSTVLDALALGDWLRRHNGDIEVTGECLRVRSSDDLVPLARDCDVLLLAADRPPDVRIWTNRACLAARRPWVDAGYHGPLVQAAAFVPGVGACWECLRGAMTDRAVQRESRSDDSPHRSAAVGNAVTATSAGISGYLAAHKVMALLTGSAPDDVGRIHTVNLARLDGPHTVADPRRPDCAACSGLFRDAAVPVAPAGSRSR